MILPIHKKAVDLWLIAKEQDENANPTIFIYSELTGKTSEKYPQAKDICELCDGINDILSHPKLSEQDKIEIQKYGIIQFRESERPSSIPFFNFLKIFTFLTFSINVLAIISIFVGGLNWWIIGLTIGTWWAKGATKMAIQKQVTDPGPKWELPAHYVIHITLIVALIIVCVKNMI
jgi:hypothetical protein